MENHNIRNLTDYRSQLATRDRKPVLTNSWLQVLQNQNCSTRSAKLFVRGNTAIKPRKPMLAGSSGLSFSMESDTRRR